MKTEECNSEVQKSIINGAYRLFVKLGCKRVTMDQIASELHISKRTIYEQFEDKRALLEACLTHRLDALKNEPIPQPIEDNGFLYVLSKLQSQTFMLDSHATMMDDIRQHYPELFEKYITKDQAAMMDKLTSVLQLEIGKGIVRPEVNPRLAAGTILGIAMQDRKNESFEGLPPEKIWGVLSKVLFTYIRGLMTIDAIKEYDNQHSALEAQMDAYMQKHLEEEIEMLK